jgi:predicted RNA-binding Zn-ribbon protein involved in translation (DUF1610 family)
MTVMAKEPLKDEVEVEVICPHCGYHLRRTAGRLRRDTPVVCPNCGEQVVPAAPAASAYVRNRGQSGHEPTWVGRSQIDLGCVKTHTSKKMYKIQFSHTASICLCAV